MANVKAMAMIAVVSSQIASIGHDEVHSILRVEFKNGDTYDYQNVNSDVFTNLKSASSVGSWFSANIKKHPGQFPFQKVSTQPTKA